MSILTWTLNTNLNRGHKLISSLDIRQKGEIVPNQTNIGNGTLLQNTTLPICQKNLDVLKKETTTQAKKEITL